MVTNCIVCSVWESDESGQVKRLQQCLQLAARTGHGPTGSQPMLKPMGLRMIHLHSQEPQKGGDPLPGALKQPVTRFQRELIAARA